MNQCIERRTLGKTGMEVTSLGFGAMELRGGIRGRTIVEDRVDRLLNEALDLGINFIDTSIDYGMSEERIGRALCRRRDEFFLASKCGCIVGWQPSANTRGPGPHDYRPENVVAGVEQSLRRMRTDHIDVMQLHGSPPMSELLAHGTIEVLEELRSAGKIGHIGISSTLPQLPEHIASGQFATVQLPYSHSQSEHELFIERAATAGAGVIVRSGVVKDAPTRQKGSRVFPGRATRLATAWDPFEFDDIRDGIDPVEFALRFAISHRAVSTVLVGTLSEQHLAENVAAVGRGPLPDEIYQAARRRLEAPAVPEPNE